MAKMLFLPPLLALLLVSCYDNPIGEFAGPDRMYQRLTQNRGKWTAINMHYHYEDSAGSVIADSVFASPGNLYFTVAESQELYPLSGQYPLPSTLWVNGEPTVVLGSGSFSDRQYHGNARRGAISVFSYDSLVLVWHGKSAFSGRFQTSKARRFVEFDAFAQ